ncbi:MAG: hypothetical protein MAG471_01453 [Acidimicrobiaceae bacterium]|nr:hypothetical protein [Acidimicrobiaceae bacterium]
MVDDHPEIGCLGQAAPPEATLLGGTCLIVDQDGHTADASQQFLGFDDSGAVPDLHAVRQVDAVVARCVLSGHEDTSDPEGEKCGGNLGDADRVWGVLAACHGDGAVEQQLVGHGHTGANGCLDGQLTRVEEGSITQVLGEVVPFHERRHSYPLGPLAAHCGDACLVTDPALIHQHGHPAAADSGSDQSPVGGLGSPVVWTT